MIDLRNIEFYGTPSGEVMIKEEGKPVRIYTQKEDLEFTTCMIEAISEFYTEAWNALCELYTRSELNRHYYEYLIVHRFIRCNFNEYDNTHDIDHHGIFRFEHVRCPLRGECRYCDVICAPRFNTRLTDRELEVMKYYFNNYTTEAIGDRLFISYRTVEKHKSNVLKKLGLHSLAEFNTYASKHNLFT